MGDLGTVITWGLGIWIATKLLPPFLAGLTQALEQKQTRDLLKQHPEHAAEIRKVQLQQALWEPPKAAKKGGGLGKLVVVACCIGYIVFPLDFIPDFIPILGWGDDLAAGIIGLKALMK